MRKFSVVLMLIISLCLIFAIFVSAAPLKEGNTVSGKIQFYESIGTGTSEITENITFTCGGVEYVSFHYYNEGTPTIELKKADGTYSYPYNGAWGAEEYRVFDFGETEQEISYGFAVLLYKYAEAYVSSITTFDLSTLGLAAGEHIITIKAKADGYLTSAASAGLTYTEIPVITLLGSNSVNNCKYSVDNGETWTTFSLTKGGTMCVESAQIMFDIPDGDYQLTIYRDETYLAAAAPGVMSDNLTFADDVTLKLSFGSHSGGSA